MMRKLALITALGNRDLVLELVDFFNAGDSCLYNPEGTAIRRRFAGARLHDLHLICTKAVLDNYSSLKALIAAEYPEINLHCIEIPCADLACDLDDERMRELVYQAVREIAADNLVISSGGRKTMTNRLIEAGLLYGCMGYLTITAPPGQEKRNCTENFHILWIPARRFFESRQQEAIKDELGDNFRSLYQLPLTVIKRLRNERLGMDPAQEAMELAWLSRLPKADLHCHLGGSFDAELLKGLAVSLLAELDTKPEEIAALHAALEARLGTPLAVLSPKHILTLAGPDTVHCLAGLKPLYRDIPWPEHIAHAVLVSRLAPEQIKALSFHKPARVANQLDWYMACGDLGGSSLLQTAGNLRQALRWLMQQAAEENLRLLEVRFSPDNYTRAGLDIPAVIENLLDEARRFMGENPALQVNFLIMATRHKELAAMSAHVAAAVTFARPGDFPGPKITGFDLAGQEEGNDPGRFADLFMPLHRHFINITIHAGEMADDDKIWQAIYLLHARRIGHGLKLVNNPRMLGYVRDHGIAIEMCPSSNAATNNFLRFDKGETQGDAYPLKKYLSKGLTVTVNTDNRGISQTTMSNEFLMAARLSEGGLSYWDMLRLIKNGFKAAFLPKDEKDRLLKQVDEEIFALILDEFFPETGRD